MNPGKKATNSGKNGETSRGERSETGREREAQETDGAGSRGSSASNIHSHPLLKSLSPILSFTKFFTWLMTLLPSISPQESKTSSGRMDVKKATQVLRNSGKISDVVHRICKRLCV
ncbi:hypothetical protein ElyMa_006690400 [Elysia marginata]|uniref:Uncharacterized protein n=1 Tax=Elysia marginata TaxID=1093978 RepID=A0AAV4IP41_9GAST|nr:hypothetical protein ElyMa_006690400 [Elysia marginata]